MVRVLSSKTHRIPENGCVAISAAPHCLVLEIVKIKRCVFWPDKDRFAGSMKHLIDNAQFKARFPYIFREKKSERFFSICLMYSGIFGTISRVN